MSYELEFLPSALKEWQKLDNSIKVQFKKKLSERLENPKVAKDKLRGYEDVYKIKLRDVGYRLAYQVKDSEIVVLVCFSLKEFALCSLYSCYQERQQC